MRHLRCVALVLLVAGAAEAGPPAVCWPIDIGDEESLPWGNPHQPFDLQAKYSVDHLEADTLRLLDRHAPLLARMETLRRATCYVQFRRKGKRSHLVGHRLLAALTRRVLDAEARGEPDALAWFDAGYLVECFRQAGVLSREGKAYGYQWLKKARKLGLKGPAFELASALLVMTEDRSAFQGHVKAARAGSKPGDAVHAHVVAFFGEPDGKTEKKEEKKKKPTAKDAKDAQKKKKKKKTADGAEMWDGDTSP